MLLGALGGEGGASVTRWIVEAAQVDGLRVQSTSIPGVAQRTGATTYYVEIAPAGTQAAQLPLALAPTPGTVHLVLASELVEAGRAMQNGFVSPELTTLAMSSHRVFAVVEKAAMGDGRHETARIDRAASLLAKRLIVFDMDRLARLHTVPIGVVLLGAAASSMPVSRAAFERVIAGSTNSGGKSLQAFAAGWATASGEVAALTEEPNSEPAPTRTNGAVLDSFPESVRPLLAHGIRRLIDYQDDAYADLYIHRVRAVADAEREGAGAAAGFAATAAVARHAALWMSYEDVVRVADLKTRLDRLDQVRRESGAAPGEVIRVYEFLKPGLEEICAMLPTRVASPLRRFVERRNWTARLNVGMRIRTNAVLGFLALRALAKLRAVRRFSSRWEAEQRQIETWLSLVRKASAMDGELAAELAECGRLVKGYGDTHRRAMRSFDLILELARAELASSAADASALSGVVRRAREAALADPEGTALDLVLAAHFRGQPAPRARQPIMMRASPHA